MDNCQQFCGSQVFKTDGGAAAAASVSSQDASLQVKCSQCTSQCGASSVETSGGGRRRKRKYSKKRNMTKKSKNNMKRRKTNRKRRRNKRNH